MWNNLQTLIIVPARGGSKGVLKKNLRTVNGKSLIQIVGEFSMNLDFVDKCVISSDDASIIDEALKYGISAPFVRPDYLSGDRVGDLEVLQHALLNSESIFSTQYDIIIMLQPTSPCRISQDVVDAIQLLLSKPTHQVWSVSKIDLRFHGYKQFFIQEQQLDFVSDSGKHIVARQELNDTFIRNGLVYAYLREHILNPNLNSLKQPLVIDRDYVNIDSETDLEKASLLMKES